MAQILTKPELLSPAYLPEKLLHREGELGELKRSLKNLINTFIYGPCGSGKTSLVKHAMMGLGREVRASYVDCSLYQTTYAVLKEILPRGDFILCRSNYELTKELVRYSGEVRLAVCFDDFERLREKDLIAKLMSLRICVVLTSEDEDALSSLSRSVRANIPCVIRLKPYTASQLVDILRARADKALARWSFKDEVLNKIAQLSKGNATLGLNLLKLAALKAEGKGKTSIELSDIPKPIENCPVRLSCDENLLLSVLREFKTLPAGRLYELYLKRARHPKGERAFREYMRRLCVKGFVKALGDKRGRIYEVVKGVEGSN